MGEAEVDPEIIRKTQESLGKIVKKPPLTEKLLRRPPFKFILDVVKVVIDNSNILEDLYTDEELNVENIKDRTDKIKFLQKLIDLLNLVTNQKIEVKPSKIVAGLEADKTNELFQALAYAIENKIDTKEAVKSLKHGFIQNGTSKTSTKTSSKNEEKVEGKSENKTRKEKTTNAKTDVKKKLTSQNSIEKKVNPPKVEKIKEKDRNGKESRSNSKSRPAIDAKEAPKRVRKTSSKEKDSTSSKRNSLLTNGSVDSQNSLTNQQSQQPQSLTIEESNENLHKSDELKTQEISNHVEDTVQDVDRPAELNGIHNNEKEIDDHETSLGQQSKPQDELVAIIDEEAEFRRREKTTKKMSSRHRQKSVEDQQAPQHSESSHQNDILPAPAKLDVNQTFKREERPKTSLRPPSARPASSRPAAPRRREKNVVEIILQPDEPVKLGEITVKMEHFTKELEDDGENLLIIEDPNVAAENENFINETLSGGNQIVVDDSKDQGKLVQQILETEKNFEGALGVQKKQQRVENVYDESKIQTNVKQIENLKEMIQKLVRSVNPLGKLMDFVQEDVDSMQREYAKWNEIYKQSSVDLRKELKETANAIEPLKYQLTQLEKQIAEHQQVIDELKGKLILDEQKIFKIFSE